MIGVSFPHRILVALVLYPESAVILSFLGGMMMGLHSVWRGRYEDLKQSTVRSEIVQIGPFSGLERRSDLR